MFDQLTKANEFGDFLSYSSTAERLLRMFRGGVPGRGGDGEVGRQLLAVSSRYKSRAEQMYALCECACVSVFCGGVSSHRFFVCLYCMPQ